MGVALDWLELYIVPKFCHSDEVSIAMEECIYCYQVDQAEKHQQDELLFY